MKPLASLFLLLASCLSASAQTVELPATVDLPSTFRPLAIDIKATGDSLKIMSGSPSLWVIREMTDPGTVRVHVMAFDPGRYKLLVVAGKSMDGKTVLVSGETIVNVGGSPPIPPAPPIEAAPKSIGLSLAFGPWSNGMVTGSTANVAGTAKITGGDPLPPGPPIPVPPAPTPTPPAPAPDAYPDPVPANDPDDPGPIDTALVSAIASSRGTLSKDELYRLARAHIDASTTIAAMRTKGPTVEAMTVGMQKLIRLAGVSVPEKMGSALGERLNSNLPRGQNYIMTEADIRKVRVQLLAIARAMTGAANAK